MRLQRSSSNVSNSKTQVSKVTKPKAELKLERFVKNNIRKSMKSPYTAKIYPVKHQLRKQRGNSSKVGTGPLKMAMKSYSSAAVPRLRAAKKLERSVKQSVKAKMKFIKAKHSRNKAEHSYVGPITRISWALPQDTPIKDQHINDEDYNERIENDGDDEAEDTEDDDTEDNDVEDDTDGKTEYDDAADEADDDAEDDDVDVEEEPSADSFHSGYTQDN